MPAILLALLAGAPVVWLGLRLLGDAMETAGRIEEIRAECRREQADQPPFL